MKKKIVLIMTLLKSMIKTLVHPGFFLNEIQINTSFHFNINSD